MVAGIFHGRKGIGVTTDSVKFLGNLVGGSPSGAFKNHVLDKVRQPAFGWFFIARPDIDPYAHRYRTGVRHLLTQNPDTII
jgi:hypothetical protein